MTGFEIAALISAIGAATAGTAAGIGSAVASNSKEAKRAAAQAATGSTRNLELYTPEQKARMNQMAGQGYEGIQALLNQPYQQLPQPPAPLDFSNLTSPYRFDFAPVAEEARNQFATQTVPSLANRFTALTGGMTRPGTASGLIGQLGSAGAGLERGLAALHSKYGLLQQSNLGNQALQQAGLQLQQQGQQYGFQTQQPYFQQQQQGQKLSILQNLLGMGMGQQFQPYHTPPAAQGPGFLQTIAPYAIQAAGSLGSSYMQNQGNQEMMKQLVQGIK